MHKSLLVTNALIYKRSPPSSSIGSIQCKRKWQIELIKQQQPTTEVTELLRYLLLIADAPQTMAKYSAALFAVALAAGSSSRSDAFTASLISTRAHRRFSQLSSSAKTETEGASADTKAATDIPDFSSSTRPTDESTIFNDSSEDAATTWQENLEALLAPDTAVAKRQIVLSDLLNAAPEIQESVRTALRDRKVSAIETDSYFLHHTYHVHNAS